MRRDSLFYLLFQQSPTLLFELLGTSPPNAGAYRFDSVAVKEPKFEIDGVFLPPEGETGIIYFCEVQFQKDERLYERLFAELFLYFYRQRDRFQNWQVVVIYPTRSIEQSVLLPYQVLLDGGQVHRIYLNELGNLSALPMGVAVMKLTTAKRSEAPEQARLLLARTRQEVLEPTRQQAIIELITTIVVYRFTEMSRQEVEAMLGLRLQDTRVYREAREEGRQEGRQEGWQEGRQEGRQEGQLTEARNLVLRQLTRRYGALPEAAQNQISQLSLSLLEQLSEALLDFDCLTDLEAWLDSHIEVS